VDALVVHGSVSQNGAEIMTTVFETNASPAAYGRFLIVGGIIAAEENDAIHY
jgi:hypothetical protein